MKILFLMIFLLSSANAFAEQFGINTSVLFHSVTPGTCFNEKSEPMEQQEPLFLGSLSPNTIAIEGNNIKFITTVAGALTIESPVIQFVTTVTTGDITTKTISDDGQKMRITYLLKDSLLAILSSGQISSHPNLKNSQIRGVEMDLEQGTYRVLNLPNENCKMRVRVGVFKLFNPQRGTAL